MGKIKKIYQNFWSDESGQGTAEYVLLLVVAIAAVLVLKKPILDALKSKMDGVSAEMGQVTTSH